MEMNVGTGKGYVSADLNKPDEPPEVDFISKSVKAKLDKTGSTLKIKK